MKLNKEEKDILDSVERDEWKSVSDLSGEKKDMKIWHEP